MHWMSAWHSYATTPWAYFDTNSSLNELERATTVLFTCNSPLNNFDLSESGTLRQDRDVDERSGALGHVCGKKLGWYSWYLEVHRGVWVSGQRKEEKEIITHNSHFKLSCQALVLSWITAAIAPPHQHTKGTTGLGRAALIWGLLMWNLSYTFHFHLCDHQFDNAANRPPSICRYLPNVWWSLWESHV